MRTAVRCGGMSRREMKGWAERGGQDMGSAGSTWTDVGRAGPQNCPYTRSEFSQILRQRPSRSVSRISAIPRTV